MGESLETIGIPELAEDQIQKLSEIGEKTAREFVLSKVVQRKIHALNITVEASGSKPVSISVEVDLRVHPTSGNLNVERLVHKATEKAFEAIEQCLREIRCKSKK